MLIDVETKTRIITDLQALDDLLQVWGINRKDYFLLGRWPVALLGYDASSMKPSGNDFVVGIHEGKTPWFGEEPRRGFQETPPPTDSIYQQQISNYIQEHGIGVHFYSFGHERFIRRLPKMGTVALKNGALFAMSALYDTIEGTAEEMLPECQEEGVGLEKGVRMLEYIRALRQAALSAHEQDTVIRADRALEEFEWIERRYQELQATLNDSSRVLRGRSVFPGVVRGIAMVVSDIRKVQITTPCVAVAERTAPGWEQWNHNIQALVIDHGGLLSHAALLARELKIPCVVQTMVGTQRIKTGDHIVVDATNGIITLPASGEK